jgi:hypothetical protein
MFMDRHHVQQVCPFFATKFSLHERSRDSPFNSLYMDYLQSLDRNRKVCRPTFGLLQLRFAYL